MKNKAICLTLFCLSLCLQAFCCNVTVTSSNGQILVSGLTDEANTKLFDAAINQVWECNPWNGNLCSANETITGLTADATYFLSVQSDACIEWIPITVVGGGSTVATCSDGIQNQDETGIDCGGSNCLPCNIPTNCNVTVTNIGTSIFILGLTNLENSKLFDSDYDVVWECNPWNGNVCNANETIYGLTTGATYFFSAQSDLCDIWIPVIIEEVTEESLPDLQVEFLAPFAGDPNEVIELDFNLINSGNADVANNFNIAIYISIDSELSSDDISAGLIQAGFIGANSSEYPTSEFYIPYDLASGNYYIIMNADDNNIISESNENNNIAVTTLTIEGVVNSECNVTATTENNSIQVIGLTTDANAKLFDADINVVFECNPWTGSPCQNEITIENLTAETTYFLSVQSDACDEWIPIEVSGDSGENEEVCEKEIQPYIGNGPTCFEAFEDGSFQLITKEIEPNYYTRRQYNSDGELDETHTYLLGIETTWSVSENKIIRNLGFNFTLDIDPTLVATYSTGDNEFAPIAAKNNDGDYFILGRVVNQSTENDIYLHKLDAQGNEISSVLLATLSDINDNYSLDEQINFIKIIPTADGGADVMLQHYLFFDPTSTYITDRYIFFEIDASFQNVVETNLGYTNSLNTIYENDVEQLHYCNTYRITKEVRNVGGGTGGTITRRIETWDYNVTPKKLLYTELFTNNSGIGAFTETGLEVIFDDGTKVIATDFEPISPFIPENPPPTLTSYDAADNIISEVEIPGVPFAIFQNNGSLSYIIGTTLYTTDCVDDGMYSDLVASTLYNTNCESCPIPDIAERMVAEESSEFKINRLFPNPTDSEAFLKIESKVNQFVNLVIYDISGSLKFTQKIELETGITTTSLNIETLPNGIYNLTIFDKDGKIETIRFIKN